MTKLIEKKMKFVLGDELYEARDVTEAVLDFRDFIQTNYEEFEANCILNDFYNFFGDFENEKTN